MAIKDWNGFKKNGDTYIPNDATARTRLQNKVDKVEGKGLSTNDYTNTAKGIVDNIQDNVIANTKLIKDTVGWSGKNKLKWYKQYKTGSNVTFTVEKNGVITIIVGTNGASASVELLADEGMSVDYMFKASDFRPNSCILSNTGTYNSNIFVEAVYRTQENIYISDERLTDVAEKKLIIPENAYYIRIAVYVKSGTPAGTYTLYPMLRDASILDDTYEPYFGSTAFPRSEQAVLGTKNLLPNDNDATRELNGVTLTRNADKTLTLSGLASADTNFYTQGTGWNAGTPISTLEIGKQYKWTYDVADSALYAKGITYALYGTKSGNTVFVAGSEVSETKTHTFTYGDIDKFFAYIHIPNGTDLSTPITLKPMISFDGGEYVPYAMTNRELTENKWDKTMVLASGDLDDYKTAGMYYWSTTAPTHAPENLTYCKMIVFVGAGSVHQVVLRGNGYIAMRQFDGSEWKAWYKVTTTVIS